METRCQVSQILLRNPLEEGHGSLEVKQSSVLERVLASQAMPATLWCVGQGGQALGDRPEPVEAQRIQGQAAERGHDLNAVDLAVAVRVFLGLHVAGPAPGVLNRPAVAHVLQQRPGARAEAGDVVTGCVDGLAVATALAADRKYHGSTGPVFRHPLRSRHSPHRPDDVTAAFVLVLAGLQRRLPPVDRRLPETPCGGYVSPRSGSRHHAVRGRRKRAVRMQRVRLNKQSLKLHPIEELAKSSDLCAGIGDIGALGDRHAQAVGL